MVRRFALDPEAHVGRILAHVFRHVREPGMGCRVGQVVIVRQVLTRPICLGDLLLVRGGGLEEHVRELGPQHGAEQGCRGGDENDEKQHADALIKRILFLEGTPDVGNRIPLNIGKDVQEMLANDLALERQVIEALKNAIAVCEKEHDYQTREILEGMLADTEEDHTYWLEKQLGLIDKVGLQNYLQSQM